MTMKALCIYGGNKLFSQLNIIQNSHLMRNHLQIMLNDSLSTVRRKSPNSPIDKCNPKVLENIELRMNEKYTLY